MADLVVDGFVTTPEIEGVENIDLEEVGKYRIVEFGPGALSWRRTEVESPVVHGRTLIHAAKDQMTLFLAIRVYGSTAAQLESRTADLLRAFEQFRYRVGITIDSVDREYYCGPADYSPHGSDTLDKFHLVNKQQLYVFNIPREPVPVEGSM